VAVSQSVGRSVKLLLAFASTVIPGFFFDEGVVGLSM
jgi:hypothetical protein